MKSKMKMNRDNKIKSTINDLDNGVVYVKVYHATPSRQLLHVH